MMENGAKVFIMAKVSITIRITKRFLKAYFTMKLKIRGSILKDRFGERRKTWSILNLKEPGSGIMV